jgi:hypothetical protein
VTFDGCDLISSVIARDYITRTAPVVRISNDSLPVFGSWGGLPMMTGVDRNAASKRFRLTRVLVSTRGEGPSPCTRGVKLI